MSDLRAQIKRLTCLLDEAPSNYDALLPDALEVLRATDEAITLLASTEDTQWRPEIRDWLENHGIDVTHGISPSDD